MCERTTRLRKAKDTMSTNRQPRRELRYVNKKKLTKLLTSLISLSPPVFPTSYWAGLSPLFGVVIHSILFYFSFSLSLSLSHCVCLCVCVLERERDRERETHSVCKFLSHCECVRVYKMRCGRVLEWFRTVRVYFTPPPPNPSSPLPLPHVNYYVCSLWICCCEWLWQCLYSWPVIDGVAV